MHASKIGKVNLKSQKVLQLPEIWTFERTLHMETSMWKSGAYEPDHTEDTFTNTLNCSKCNEIHTADSKLCKIWEKIEFIKIKVTQNISFPEARRLIEMPFIKTAFSKITKTFRITTV